MGIIPRPRRFRALSQNERRAVHPGVFAPPAQAPQASARLRNRNFDYCVTADTPLRFSRTEGARKISEDLQWP